MFLPDSIRNRVEIIGLTIPQLRRLLDQRLHLRNHHFSPQKSSQWFHSRILHIQLWSSNFTTHHCQNLHCDFFVSFKRQFLQKISFCSVSILLRPWNCPRHHVYLRQDRVSIALANQQLPASWMHYLSLNMHFVDLHSEYSDWCLLVL